MDFSCATREARLSSCVNLEGGLALIHGRHIVAWMESDFAEAAGGAITRVTVGLMVYSTMK